MEGRRYSLEGLVTASGLSEAALARSVGLSGNTLKAVRRRGFSEDQADRYAVRAGLHPSMVWSDWFDGAAVVCPECEARFVPRPNQRWCSRKCRNLASSREWKRRNAEKNRQARRAYYAENGDYERARQRRYERVASSRPQGSDAEVAA